MSNTMSTNTSCNSLSCKLSGPEFRQRKETIIAELRRDVQEIRETGTGYLYKFDGSDITLDRLLGFIKTERQCCEFFTFTLSVTDAQSPLWLEIAGPEGAKEFIRTELNFGRIDDTSSENNNHA